MSRRFLSPIQIILLLLLTGLVILLVFQNRKGSKTDLPARQSGPAFDDEAVREVSFQRGSVFVRVVRETDGFWIVEPYRDRADDRFVAQVLRVAATLRPLRSLPDTAGARFGLASPSAIWRCTWPGGSSEIALGDSLPAGGGRFARRSGSAEVLVIDPFLARRYLAPPVADIHGPMPALLEVGPVDSVLIETREETLVAVRHRADFWEFVKPMRVEGSAVQIARAVESLRTDALTEFLGPTSQNDLRAMGLDPPRATWTLFQGTRRQTIRIGHPTADEKSVRVIPADREVVALISSENFRQWVDGSSRLRETLVLETPEDSVKRVDASGPGQRRVFVRRGPAVWREVAGAETLAVRSEGLARMIQNTCQIRAVRFSQHDDLRDWHGEIRLFFLRSSGKTDTLRISPPRAGVSLAESRRQPGGCVISGDAYRAWSIWLERPLRP